MAVRAAHERSAAALDALRINAGACRLLRPFGLESPLGWQVSGGWRQFPFVWLVVCVIGLSGRVQAESTPSAQVAATERLLAALEQRQMQDVALWVLDRLERDPATPAGLRGEVSLRRATALVALARSATNAAKRTALHDQAAREIEVFLATGPTGEQAINAYLQQGNLRLEQGRAKIEAASRPGAAAAMLREEALGFFDKAIDSLEGIEREPGKENGRAASAEGAILSQLREVDAQLASLDGGKSGGGQEDAPPKAKKQPRRPVGAVTRQKEQVEDQQDSLRARLLQTRLLSAGARYEKSKALPPGSAQWVAVLRDSAGRYRALYEKYPTRGAGLFARYYEGRNYVLLAQAAQQPQERQDLYALALQTLQSVRALEGETGVVPSLRIKAMNSSLECWLETEDNAAFDDRLLKIVLAPLPPQGVDADRLGMKYRAAMLLNKRAASLPDDQKSRRTGLVRDAQRLALEVAKVRKDFSREARQLLVDLGRDLPDEENGATASFATAFDVARGALAEMQARQAVAQQAAAAGDPAAAEAAKQAVVEQREKAIGAFRRCLALAADKDSSEALNHARYLLAYLLYDAQRWAEAAALGGLLTERYPNGKGSRQAAKIALASWQQLARDPAYPWKAAARGRGADLAERIMRLWPGEGESIDAALVAVATAAEARDPARVIALLDALPTDAPWRGEVLLRGGASVWRECLEQLRLPEAQRASEELRKLWREKARQALDTGLQGLAPTAPPGLAAVAGALARCQMALDENDPALAARLLEHPQYGPWTVLNSGRAGFATGPLAESAASVSLRFFIQSQQIEKAQQAMERLEQAAGTGSGAAARLSALYVALARDLEAQLTSLGTGERAANPENRATAMALLAGFETFLEGVARRDTKVTARMWVATTYLALGSGTGTGSMVPGEKAQAYLGRAAATYEALLESGGEEVEPLIPSIHIKLMSVYRSLGRWEEAFGHLESILSDPRRANGLDVQTQAAEMLQAAGEQVSDRSAAERYLREAIAGTKTSGGGVVWGWGGLANRLARQALGEATAQSAELRSRFFSARLNLAACRLTQAGKSEQSRDKLLGMAESDIRLTYKLYPDLGGEASRRQFDRLLKEIQRARGVASPQGLPALEAATATAQ